MQINNVLYIVQGVGITKDKVSAIHRTRCLHSSVWSLKTRLQTVDILWVELVQFCYFLYKYLCVFPQLDCIMGSQKNIYNFLFWEQSCTIPNMSINIMSHFSVISQDLSDLSARFVFKSSYCAALKILIFFVQV